MKVTVINSKNKFTIGLEGKIIDETQHTLTLLTARGRKRLLKEQVTLEITDNGKKSIPGKALAKRPEDRIRMRLGKE